MSSLDNTPEVIFFFSYTVLRKTLSILLAEVLAFKTAILFIGLRLNLFTLASTFPFSSEIIILK